MHKSADCCVFTESNPINIALHYAEYEKLTAEVGTRETLEVDAAIKKSINDTFLPLANGSLEKLGGINHILKIL